VELKISGTLEINGESIRLSDTEGHRQIQGAEISRIESQEGSPNHSRDSKEVEPTISADFFADDSTPAVDFGEEV